MYHAHIKNTFMGIQELLSNKFSSKKRCSNVLIHGRRNLRVKKKMSKRTSFPAREWNQFSLNTNENPAPSLVPPTHVLLNVPVGHVALAALTQPSHRPLLTLIVAPLAAFTAVSVNFDVPDAPTVVEGSPPQN